MSRTLDSLLKEQAFLHADRLAVITPTNSVTYGQLHERASRVAARLRNDGIVRGDRVGILVSNRIEWLEIFFGAVTVGAVVVPFSTWSTSAELEALVEDADLKILFAATAFGDRDFMADLQRLQGEGLRVVALDAPGTDMFDRYEDFPAEGPVEILPPGAGSSAGDDALILYTSGSTSVPKAVRLAHFGLIENGFNIGERQGLSGTDRILLSAPLFWAYGGANALQATMTHGATLVLLEKFDAGLALDMIERHSCTSIYTLPAMTGALVRHPAFTPARTASVRTGVTIGNEEEFLLAADGLGIPHLCNVYGLTETYGNCAVTWHEWPQEQRARSQGTMLPGQLIRIRDEATGEIIPSDQLGLIEIGGYVTPGYSGKSAALNGDIFTEDGYYRTGDIGHLNEAGGLIFSGRSTEMIKRAGINVSPAEVEAAMARHGSVAQVAVVGVTDDRRGELIFAYVVPTGDGASVDEIYVFLRAQISKYKIPDWIEFCDDLPLTVTGKLHRKQMKENAKDLMAQRLRSVS
ncbi:fatty-acyl-CoA synthase [Sphingobium faniae]|nr:fatty-acyl-CoA synthase [Sphingobium faniae]